MTQLVTGAKTMAAAGTAEAILSTRTEVISAIIQAKPGNTSTIKIRDAAAGTDGLTLNAGQTFEISARWVQDTFDLATVFLKAAVNGEGVDFVYWK